MDDFFTLFGDWERQALAELYSEYRYILKQRRVEIPPAAIDIFDSETHWGRWNSETRTIQLSRKLLRGHPWFQVLGIFKHEMAHQLVDDLKHHQIRNGKPHGEAFEWACQKLGVPEQFSKASVDLQTHGLDWRTEKRDEASEKMLDKVRKLLALAGSSNEHEAVAAMNRVRAIYAKHNLEPKENSQFVHLVISNGQKRMEAHEKKIVGILVGHFFVQVLCGQTYDIRTGEYHKMIELIGRRENVLMAEYVYHFLLRQSDLLVDQMAKGGQRLHRLTRKSYRLGILQGFSEKLSVTEKPSDTPDPTASLISKALVAFHGDRDLEGYLSKVYPSLKSIRTSSQRIDSQAYAAGKTMGAQLTLNRPIAGARETQERFLEGK